MFKVIVGLVLLAGHLSAAEVETETPNRAGTVVPGPLLMAEIDRWRQRERVEGQNDWPPEKEQSVAPRAGTIPTPCHRPDNHPHRGHTHQGLPNPHSAKNHSINTGNN